MRITEMLWRGMRAARAGRRKEARDAFLAALCQDPNNETALVWLGYLADAPQDSIAYTTQALEAHPQNKRACAALQWAWQRSTSSSPPVSPERPAPVFTRRSSHAHWAVYQFGLSILVLCLMTSALVGWTLSPQMQTAPPAVAAAAVFTPSPPAATAPSTPDAPLPLFVTPDSPTPLPATPTPLPASPTPPHPDASFVVPSPFPTMDAEAIAQASAIVSYTLAIPTPVQPVPVSADAVNIVVLGSDQRPDWSQWHTDVVQVVSIQLEHGTVSVISIPRDIYLYIPGFWMSRINFADLYGETYNYEGGGPALVRDTLLYNLGIRVDHYARTNFDGLIGIVDTIGGIDVPVHCRLSDYWPYPDENGEYPILTVEPGVLHLDGEHALWYARSRKTTSVFSRERRQQQVLQGIWHKARNIGLLTQVPALWRQRRDMVETDLTFADVMKLAQMALTLDDRNVRFYNIGPDMVTPWTTPYGGAVFLPQWENIQPMLTEAMAPPPEARMGRTFMTVQVWNGTTNPGWDALAADRLYRAGFPAVTGEPDRHHYTHTRLIIFGERSKGSGAGYLQQMFQIPDDQVIHREESSEYGFRLIIGADYQTCPYPN